jgi:hypothetical protein
MSNKRQRFIGTSEEAVAKAETELNFKFSPSFRSWLIQNNGLCVEDVNIFPVFDERDARKTFDSIVRNYKVNWLDWLEKFEDKEISFEHLLPFVEFGTGDFYCFDYSKIDSNGEVPVVHWSQKTGETEIRGENFEDFLEKLKRGEFDFD